MHCKNDILQNACFPVLQKRYISNMRGIIGGGGLLFNRDYYRRSTVAGNGYSVPINRLSDYNGDAVYRPTGVITDGLSLWVWYSVPINRLSGCNHIRHIGAGNRRCNFCAKRYISSACFYVKCTENAPLLYHFSFWYF